MKRHVAGLLAAFAVFSLAVPAKAQVYPPAVRILVLEELPIEGGVGSMELIGIYPSRCKYVRPKTASGTGVWAPFVYIVSGQPKHDCTAPVPSASPPLKRH